MRRFIIHSILFSALVGLGYASHLLIRHHIASAPDASRMYVFQDGWITRLAHPPRVLLMGSSTVAFGLDATALGTDAVNLAATARTPVQSLALFERLDDLVSEADVLVYGLDPWVFTQDYVKHDPVRGNPHGIPGFRIYRRILQTEPKLVVGPIPDMRGTQILSDIPKNFGGPVAEWFGGPDKSWDEPAFASLNSLHQLATDNGTRVVFWIPPRRGDWRDAYAACCANIETDFMARIRSISPGISIIDHSEIIPQELEARMFMDGVHLSREGQVFATQRIRNALE